MGTEEQLKNASQIVQSYWDLHKSKGLQVPRSKPKFTSAIEVAQRKGRVAGAGALAPKAVSIAGKAIPGPSRKRRITTARAHATRPVDS